MTAFCLPFAANGQRSADVVVIGAGISGLSAALEAANRGAQVLVVDQATAGGGHAILSNGAVCLVRTPLQAAQKIEDSPELAAKDFQTRGEDARPEWVSRYVRDSKVDLYDWLEGLGVRFEFLVRPPGNTVPRLHLVKGKGWGLVGPIFQECLRHPRVRFLWATRALDLVVTKGRVAGVRTLEVRTGKKRTIRSRNIIVATGGFGNNLSMVLRNWPAGEPKPQRLLLGSAHTATGDGHEMAVRSGGILERMDHQWNYIMGLPDPRDSEGRRGLAAFNFNGIWVNQSGNRFTQEFGDPKSGLASLLRQPGGSYWTVFDEQGKRGFSITLAGWDNFRDVSKIVYERDGVVLSAPSLNELAKKMQVPEDALRRSVERFNELTTKGVDEDFQAFGPRTTPKPKPINTPPFYAARFFPITRKSMGGVKVDTECRVLNSAGNAIPGLFAVGEVTGFGGINGRAALEGTFLGPGMYMGRVAGRAVQAQGSAVSKAQIRPAPQALARGEFADSECAKCHVVAEDVAKERDGYWHYQQSHRKVLDRGYKCSQCHSDLHPYRKGSHRMDRLAQTLNCVTCHGVQRGSGGGEP